MLGNYRYRTFTVSSYDFGSLHERLGATARALPLLSFRSKLHYCGKWCEVNWSVLEQIIMASDISNCHVIAIGLCFV